MNKPTLVMAYDVGTTGVKTCLFEITDTIKIVASAMEGYELFVLPEGGAEQDPAQWWSAMCSTTKEVIKKAGIAPEEIKGVSFCSQMQGLVLVDKNGEPVRRAMSYMDQRAREELQKGIAHGPQIAGANIFKLLKSLMITGAVAASVKDPVWKYKWVEAHEPENFSRVYKWLDVKEYLICKLTGEFIMTQDSAFASLLYDIRKGKEDWSPEICKMLGVNTDHLAKIIKSTDKVGGVTEKAAAEIGLAPGTAVFGGGGDASLIGVGAGSVKVGDTHIYSGTSGWVSTVVDKSIVDTSAMIAAVVGADEGKFNYFAELETAGKCLEWVKDHLALEKFLDVCKGFVGHAFLPFSNDAKDAGFRCKKPPAGHCATGTVLHHGTALSECPRRPHRRRRDKRRTRARAGSSRRDPSSFSLENRRYYTRKTGSLQVDTIGSRR